MLEAADRPVQAERRSHSSATGQRSPIAAVHHAPPRHMAQAELADLATADACRGKAENPVVVRGNHEDPKELLAQIAWSEGWRCSKSTT